MTVGYTDTPHNISEIVPYVIMNEEQLIEEIYRSSQCYFYDTCSFRRHANLDETSVDYLLQYIKDQKGIVVITRCILMELASHSGMLNPEYIEYIKRIHGCGIPVLVMFEEDLFAVMEVCFATNAAINTYLCWAVRTIKRPVSTITEVLKKNESINSEVMKGKNIDNAGIYQRFFAAVRANKETGDNLGEELLAICLHILSYLPGENDGKFCVITDDKGAIGKIGSLFRKTAEQHKGKDIGIFSTPKLVQVLHREGVLKEKEHIKDMLSYGTDGKISILGMRYYDIGAKELSFDVEDLADLIMQPNGISISY